MQTCCNQECRAKMPKIPPGIDAPPSCCFMTIRRPKTEKPMAMPNKLIAVDIFSSRLCVLILNSSWASSTYKGVRNPEFQEIGRILRRGTRHLPPILGEATEWKNLWRNHAGGFRRIRQSGPDPS